MKKTYYEILGVTPNAELATIKQAAQLKIKQIKEIYTILGDHQKRKIYDAQTPVNTTSSDELPVSKSTFSFPQHVNVLPEKKAKKPLSIQSVALRSNIRHGAYWFYWIALLSLIDSALLYFDGHLIISLGISQLTEILGNQWVELSEYSGIMLDVAIAGIFSLFGFFAAKGQKSAFILGMLLYTLDGTLFWLIPPYPNLLGIGFHLFVLFWIYHGLRACFADSASSSLN